MSHNYISVELVKFAVVYGTADFFRDFDICAVEKVVQFDGLRSSPSNSFSYVVRPYIKQISCCPCSGHGSGGGGASGAKASLPLICLVPRDDARLPDQRNRGRKRPASAGPTGQSDFQLLDEDYIKKHFNLPQRALYLDPFRRPLITFPMTQEDAKNFNLARKYKINQQILDGFLDASEAISAPSVFPYAQSKADKNKEVEDEEEIIYILQLPDWEYKCPVHSQTIRTPRFIWHSCKKPTTGKGNELKQGGGPLNKPKPWLLSRHTDFDLLSQW